MSHPTAGQPFSELRRRGAAEIEVSVEAPAQPVPAARLAPSPAGAPA
jgi:hypothetical protein